MSTDGMLLKDIKDPKELFEAIVNNAVIAGHITTSQGDALALLMQGQLPPSTPKMDRITASTVPAHHKYRKITDKSQQEAADQMFEVLWNLGVNTNDASTRDTPERWVRYIKEYTQGDGPLQEVLGELFDHDRGDSTHAMVIQTGIPFRMICEHHLLPATGFGHIGYLPGKKVVGLSKLARLVDAVGVSRPWLQEAITQKIADVLMHNAEAVGVMVILEAQHSCMACRGVNKPNVNTITSSVLGLYRDVPAARAEFLALISKGH